MEPQQPENEVSAKEDSLEDEVLENGEPLEIEPPSTTESEESDALKEIDLDFEKIESPEDEEAPPLTVSNEPIDDPLLELKTLCKVINQRVRQDLDFAWAIVGPEGSGKTQLALQAAKLMDSKFTCERNVLAFPSISAIMEKTKQLPKYSPIVLDEAIKTFYNRNAMSSGNKRLMQFFRMCRKLNFIWILCLPRFTELEKGIRESRVGVVSMIPSVRDTGTAVCFDREECGFADSGWFWKESYDMIRYTATKQYQRLGRLSQNHRLALYKSTPNYFMTLHYPFDKKLKREYDDFLEQHQATGLFGNEFEVNTKQDNIMVLRVEKAIHLMAAKGISEAEVAEALVMSPKEVRAALAKKGYTKDDITLNQLREETQQNILNGNAFVRKVDAPAQAVELPVTRPVEKPAWTGKTYSDAVFDI